MTTKSVLEILAAIQNRQRTKATAAQQAKSASAPVKGRIAGAIEPPLFPLDTALSPSFDAALRGMADRPFLATQQYQEQQWRAVRKGANPFLLRFEETMVARMAKLGVPMFASEVIRTPERQNDLYALGHSKARAGESPHQFGLAVDLVHSLKGWGLDEKQWQLVGHVGHETAKALGIAVEWGGDWKFYDPAHWELDVWKTWKDQYPWQ